MDGMPEKIYANALFELANEQSSLEEVFEEIKTLSKIFLDNSELQKLLSAPTLTLAEKLSIIENIFNGKISKLVFNFLNVVVEKKRISFFDKIELEFRNLYNDRNGILEITVTTTTALSVVLKEKLITKLESISAKKITLVETIDATIMGGIILNYGNTQLDASVKSKLDAMRWQINSIIA